MGQGLSVVLSIWQNMYNRLDIFFKLNFILVSCEIKQDIDDCELGFGTFDQMFNMLLFIQFVGKQLVYLCSCVVYACACFGRCYGPQFQRT